MATQPTNIRFINPSTLATPPGYTHVVEITQGRTLFIAAQVALDQSGKIVGQHDFRAQTQQVFENLKAALAAVGADFTCVVKRSGTVAAICSKVSSTCCGSCCSAACSSSRGARLLLCRPSACTVWDTSRKLCARL
jgi:Endoribonuclease L-PSP